MKDVTPEPIEAEGTDSASLLETLFRDAHRELLGTLFYLVGNLEDARDALQETFLKCWRNQEQVESVDNLKAWVFRIALNTGRDLRKTAWRRRREALPEESLMLANAPSPASEIEMREQLDRVRNAVLTLRPEEQEVFLLRQNGELTYEQIAAAINVPIGTVKTRMRAALNHLRQSVGGQV
ncbi:MAG: RNA polymerase sigma factor [Pirellulaceae bacterium]